MVLDINFLTEAALTVGSVSINLAQIIIIPLLCVMGFLFIKLSSRLIKSQLFQHKLSPDLIQAIMRIYFLMIIGILAMLILHWMNVPLAAFAFISGAVAIGVGFGAQNIINNFISGWILMWERPIRIGDFLEIGEAKGTVEAVNTRSTRIRRADGVHMLIPNSHFLENTVVNWTLLDQTVRTTVRVGVAYGTSPRKTSMLIEQAAKEHPLVLMNPESIVVFEDFGDSALIFDLYLWANITIEKGIKVIRSDIRYRIEELFDENGIEIAFPQKDIHLDGELVIKNR